jgi:D-xylonolactonase
VSVRVHAELAVDVPCKTGEGPIWHDGENALYFVDIPEGRLYRWDPVAQTLDERLPDRGESGGRARAVGGLTVQEDGRLLLFMGGGRVAFWDGANVEVVVDEIARERASRFNDVIADPTGRVFCGTMPGEGQLGCLYRLDLDGSLHTMLEDVETSNGMGFTPDHSCMYFIDSPKRRIDLFDYDRASGDLSNRRTFVDTAEIDGVPDGMTVDAQGCVWCAFYGGGCAVRFDPDGRETHRIELPAPNVTCPAFGGSRRDVLYITTAGGDKREEQGAAAGSLFRAAPETQGVPEFPSRIGIT